MRVKKAVIACNKRKQNHMEFQQYARFLAPLNPVLSRLSWG